MFESKEGLKWFGETGMDCENQTLPGPALGHDLWKSLTNKSEIDEDYFAAQWFGEGIVRELPIVIQDMDFYLDIEKVFCSFNFLFAIEDLLILCHISLFFCSCSYKMPRVRLVNSTQLIMTTQITQMEAKGTGQSCFRQLTCSYTFL